jgi:hypothetical protein
MKESNDSQMKLPKIDPEMVFKEQLVSLASAANENDKALINEITGLAKSEKRLIKLFSLSPAVCASLFLHANGHNRDFSLLHAEELSRRMSSGLWKPNNATIGFYVDGEIGDGQHRLAAAAHAGYALVDYAFVFGMNRTAIDTVDSPKVRDGATHAKLDGIQEANAKQSIVKNFSAYMIRAGQKSFALRSAGEVKAAIEENDRSLDKCIHIGAESVKGRISPVFKQTQAASLAYIMIKNSWPEQRIREKLALFQAGVSQDGDTPYFVAGKLVENSRRARETKDRLTGVKELGVAIYAMVQTERGINATKASNIKAEVKGKTMPDPRYPMPTADEEPPKAA